MSNARLLADQLADHLDHLATLTDWRHTDELVTGLESALDALASGSSASLPSVPPEPPSTHSADDWYRFGPTADPPLAHDVEWSVDFVEIVEPGSVTRLDDWGVDAGGPHRVGSLAVTAPFRVLSDAGVAALQAIVGDLVAEAVDFAGRRVPRHSRGAIYRSQFIRGLHTDPTILEFLSSLAGTNIEAHPNGHHASHFNFAPTDLTKAVDSWHTDVTAFDAVMHVFDTDGMKGGAFTYFDGPADEGRAMLSSGGLPLDRMVTPTFPGAGWMIFQQGHCVLHRAEPLLEPWRRCTYVPSYMAHHDTVDDPDVLGTLVSIDGPDVAPVAWARHRCIVGARRLRAAARRDVNAASVEFDLRRHDLIAVLDGLRNPTPTPLLDDG